MSRSSPSSRRGDVNSNVVIVITVVVIAAIGIIGLVLRSKHRQAAVAPAGTSLTPAGNDLSGTPPAGQRTMQQIGADINRELAIIGDSLQSPENLISATSRAAAATKSLPSLRKLIRYADELMLIPSMAEQGVQMKQQFLTLALVLDDPDALKIVTAAANSNNPDTLQAKAALLFSQWCHANGAAAEQNATLDQAEAQAKANPASNEITGVIMSMADLGPATPEIKARANSIAAGMTSDAARQLQNLAKLQALENKPLVLKGPGLDGKEFSTEQYKGKVVLVDFWATWCEPCLAELPRVKKAYADFHDKGLEIVGVSNDRKAEDLTKFLAADKQMAWPQLFDATAATKNTWNPITLNLGIDGIPVMFLIDKQGICRSVSARENFEELIPKLLAEK